MEKTEIYVDLIKKVHRIYCDHCGVELELTKKFMSCPPQYEYMCPSCLEGYVYSKCYPYEEIIGRRNDEPI